MAHLNVIRPGEDRGQIILVIGFMLAVSFVALALILNAAIYAENVASRSDTAIDGDPVDVRQETRAATRSILDYVNTHNYTAESTVQDSLRRNIEEYGDFAGRYAAIDSRYRATSVDSITSGSRIVQTEKGRSLTKRNGTVHWILARDTQVRAFEMAVSDNRSTVGGCSPTGDCFRLRITNPATGDTWQMAVYEDTSDMVVDVEQPGGTTFTCSPPPDGNDTTRIDLAAGTVDGQECAELGHGIPGPPYDIEIRNGNLSTGTYEMIVDNETIANSPDAGRFFGPTSSDSPRVTHAAYSTLLGLDQQTDRVTYNGTIRVAPGELP